MKKIAIALTLLLPIFAIAQKEIKPSLPKAEKALRAGTLDEAKSIIDATVANQEFMVDKKGGPSKNAAKAYYMKGLIYAALDTTKNEKYKSLDPKPLDAAMAAFDKSQEIDGGKTTYFLMKPDGVVPMLDNEVKGILAQHYLELAFKYGQETKEYDKAFAEMLKVLYFVPNDTTQLMNAGVYFGPAAGEYRKAEELILKYLAKGGRNEDAYLNLVDIYYDKDKDNVKALKAVKDARIKFPNNTEFPKYELNIYLSEDKYDLARKTVMDDIKRNPEEKENWQRLGGLNTRLGNIDSAKIAYQKAVDLDPGYFEAQLDLSKLYYLDAKKIKTERDKLGISPADIAKRKVLFDQLQAKYKTALPYWERALKISPDDETVLYTLREMYIALVMDDKALVIEKKMKALGYEN